MVSTVVDKNYRTEGTTTIASQPCNSGQSSTNPLSTDKATTAGAVTLVNYPTKYADLTTKVKTRYDSLNVPYKGTDHNGVGFWTDTTIKKRIKNN